MIHDHNIWHMFFLRVLGSYEFLCDNSGTLGDVRRVGTFEWEMVVVHLNGGGGGEWRKRKRNEATGNVT